MILKGLLINFKEHNLQTGISIACVQIPSLNKTILCDGIFFDYTNGTPLLLEGQFEKEIFKVSSVKASSFSYEISMKILKSKSYQGIGPKKATEILNKYGYDIYNYRRANILDDNETLKSIIKVTNYYTFFEDLYMYLSKFNVSYNYVKYLYNDYLFDSMDKLKENPFVLMDYGIDIYVCNLIATDLKTLKLNTKRMEALVKKIIQTNQNNGHTRILLEDFISLYNESEKKMSQNFHVNQFLLMNYIVQNYTIVEEENNLSFIYTKFDYINEKNIVQHINRLQTNKSTFDFNCKYIDAVENLLKCSYSRSQKECFKLLSSSGIKILTGGPGTGKTTVIKGIIQAFKMINPNGNLILAAPTGNAAKRMYDSTGIKAYTIHSALGITPYQTLEEITLNIKKLDYDFVIVDESSMVDSFIFSCLLKSLKNGTTLLLIGDNNQLPSVGNGNILGDLIQSKSFEHYHLDTIFRQSGESSIITNSKMVINGINNLKEDDNFKIFYAKTEDEMVNMATNIARERYLKDEDFKLFSPVKKNVYKTGTNNMNNLLHNVYFKSKFINDSNAIKYGSNTFDIGDKVIFNVNTDKYYNGLEGTIIDIQIIRNKRHITIETSDDTINITDKDLRNMSLNYAQTAHKSQGNECETCVILVPKKPMSMLKRQLLYVEITRAKKNVIIITQGDKINNALNVCISSKMEVKRNTGLIFKLENKNLLYLL